MTTNPERCPFKAGDLVVYRPSDHGFAAEVMGSATERLVPGHVYRVARIEGEKYVVVEGHNHPGGGLFWTEFQLSA